MPHTPPTPQESPREQRRHRRRQEIIAAGRLLVARRGAQDLSLRAVAKEAQYSPAALYEYFTNKEELLAALTAEVSQDLAAALAAVPEGLPPTERVVALGTAYVRFALAAPSDFTLMFRESRSRRRGLDEPLGGDDAYSLVAQAVGAALADGHHDATTVEVIAYAVWSLAHGQATLQLTHLRGFDADFAAADEAALRALVRGFLVANNR